MKIIISPAKKMNIDTDTLAFRSMPVCFAVPEKNNGWLWIRLPVVWISSLSCPIQGLILI